MVRRLEPETVQAQSEQVETAYLRQVGAAGQVGKEWVAVGQRAILLLPGLSQVVRLVCAGRATLTRSPK